MKKFLSRRRSNSSRHGFTLMEVLLVLGILGIIMSMVVPKVLGRQKHAGIDATRISIAGLSQAIKLYSIDHNSFPTTAEGLDVLIRRPDRNDSSWKGPYLEQQPKDAWGRSFVYTCPGRHNQDGFDLVSSGPDGIPGNTDDVSNWQESTGIPAQP